MENNTEKKEKLPSVTETLSAETLHNIVYENEGLPKDKRFNLSENGGVFKYFDPTEIVHYKSIKFYSLIKLGDKIIGLCELEKSPDQEKTFWIKFLSIDPEYQGRGYASKLAEEVFNFAKQREYTLVGSIYSHEGDQKLKPLFNKLAEKLSVNYIDSHKARQNNG